ncbi:hypothetical protein FN846DRAFT_906347 [Sphaerosporella brunnea]|uniref:Uncharacterized protein n=1 Tax=Sphaerosporella brunnea TaxID=1250544 RepID=A0A5J5EYM6_9PEZI|nr:hypothetical protein FN846DRAFT_906347 [Sphaerosporella brunnea]
MSSPTANYKYQALGTHLKTNRKLQGLLGALGIFVLFAGIWALAPRVHHPSSQHANIVPGRSKDAEGNPAWTFADGTVFVKPKEVAVHALVFWETWESGVVGECYLRRNLVKNGGLLEKVIFVTTAKDPGDLAALEKVIKSEPEVYQHGVTRHMASRGVPHSAWDGIELDPEVLYIKLDSTITYISDAAIPALVQHRLAHKAPLMISANTINNPPLSQLHARLGAVRPFLPEPLPPKPTPLTNWRTSSLPLLPPPKAGYTPKAPKSHHRWLPVNATNLDSTPARYDGDWTGWEVAAQAHYSFFQNAEIAGGLAGYNFGAWDMEYERLGVGMVALWGKDAVEHLPVNRDEAGFWTVDISKKLKRHVIVDGRALAALYAFGTQEEDGLKRTDVLQRYKAFAKEFCV